MPPSRRRHPRCQGCGHRHPPPEPNVPTCRDCGLPVLANPPASRLPASTPSQGPSNGGGGQRRTTAPENGGGQLPSARRNMPQPQYVPGYMPGYTPQNYGQRAQRVPVADPTPAPAPAPVPGPEYIPRGNGKRQQLQDLRQAPAAAARPTTTTMTTQPAATRQPTATPQPPLQHGRNTRDQAPSPQSNIGNDGTLPRPPFTTYTSDPTGSYDPRYYSYYTANPGTGRRL